MKPESLFENGTGCENDFLVCILLYVQSLGRCGISRTEAVLKKLFHHPDYVTARTKWLLRAGLPRVGEAAAADGQLIYAAEPAPGVEMKRTRAGLP